MDVIENWRAAPLTARRDIITSLVAATSSHPAVDPLTLVRAPEHWGVYASLGPNFQYAVFGRDSIETAEDILDTHPELVHEMLLMLCRLQGTGYGEQSEEEPGKIHHEYRARFLDGLEIPEGSQLIMHNLQQIWGGAGTDEMVYYGAHDSTPLFVRLLDRYCLVYGADILNESTPQHNSDQLSTVRRCAEAALAWLETKISDDTSGLFAYRRLSQNGIVNQAWKDSPTSYLHTDGSLPDPNAAVASIELQGYAYDALRAGIRMELGSADDRNRWDKTAKHIQHQTVHLLWMDEAEYFAQGIDFTNPAAPRIIATITSNPAVLLDSELLHDLPTSEAERYIQPITRMVLSDQLLTSVGVRCRSTYNWPLLDFVDYHGPNTVWPKETYDIAKGFRRAGLHQLADDLEQRLLYGLQEAGEFSEFFYVSRNGNVWYDPEEALQHFGAQSPGHTLPVPEPAQAWTIAAAIRILHERKVRGRKPTTQTQTDSVLEPVA